MYEKTFNKMIQELNFLKNNWETHPENHNQLDANWVCVKFLNKDAALAKSLGLKKESYWGWIAWSGSANTNGSNFAVEVEKIVMKYKDFDLAVRERQL